MRRLWELSGCLCAWCQGVFISLLKQTKVKIDAASSGDEGLKYAFGKKYDLIFLDHMMPEKDGIETLHELRAKKEGNPNLATTAICLTANAISGAREEYIEAGFDDYLTKPIDPQRLEEMMLKCLPEEKIERKNVPSEMEEEPEEKHLREMMATKEKLLNDTREAYESYKMGMTDKETYLVQKSSYDSMLKKLSDSISRQEQAVDVLRSEQAEYEKKGIQIGEEGVKFENADKPTEGWLWRLVDAFVKEVRVYAKDRIEIVWSFSKPEE